MSNEVSKRFSRKVTIVSFLLSIFIMYIHANKLVGDYVDAKGTPIYILNKIIAGTFGQVGVPFFFLQSGYWMFRFDIFAEKSGILKKKLMRKLYSLGVPFLLWNTFGLLFYLITTRLPVIGSMFYEGRVLPFTLKNILGGIFLHQYYIVFWFMQDLIVVTALSPLIMRLLRNRYCAYATVFVLFVLTVLNKNLPVFQTSSLLLFTMGGVLSVYHREYWETYRGNEAEAGGYLILFLIFGAFRWLSLPYFSAAATILSPILFWKSCDLLTWTHIFDKEPLWFCKQSFFIYAAHNIPVAVLSAISLKVSNQMTWISICFVAVPLIVLACLYVAARFLDRRLPKVYRLLCGGRS